MWSTYRRKAATKRGGQTIGRVLLAGSLLWVLPTLSGAADGLSEAAARTLETKIGMLSNPESREPAS